MAQARRRAGAGVDALEVMNRFEHDTDGAGSVTLGGGERTSGVRHVESILPVAVPVYVLGIVQEEGESARRRGTRRDGS